MNCFEFHRQCLVDPNCNENAFAEHMNGCKNCKQYLSQIQKLDERLDYAIKVNPPESMQSRVLLHQSLQYSSKKRVLISFFAMAASLLIVFGLTLTDWKPGNAGLDAELVNYVAGNHVDYADSTQIDDNTVADVLNPLGLSLASKFGPLKAAQPCIIRGQNAAHLVLEGKSGQISILYMPAEEINNRINTSYGGNEVIIYPCPKGTVAIIGKKGEALADIEQQLKAASTWL